MKLRGIEFGSVLGASGVQGFFGEGYWYHHPLRPIGLDFQGMTFVAKTTTLEARKGNMPLTRRFTPREWRPRCIAVNFKEGVALNAVGLSGPGAYALLMTGGWQNRRDPFFLSFMSVAKTPAERLDELSGFVRLMRAHGPFLGEVGLQLNFSCPNTGHELTELAREVTHALEIAAPLGIPLMPKFNLNLSIADAKEIASHPNCDALCISNTLPWKDVPDADRIRLFGSTTSPLAKVDPNGGGLSGKYLFPKLLTWITAAHAAGIRKPLNVGGGILGFEEAFTARAMAGRNGSIALGSIAFLRPWRVREITTRIPALERDIERESAELVEARS